MKPPTGTPETMRTLIYLDMYTYHQNHQIKDCPKCKTKHGWFEKRRTTRQQYFTATGEPSHSVDENESGGKIK